ncbi:hypothetical protein VTN02DRAFT_3384 [Thermoascus thermophilus]
MMARLSTTSSANGAPFRIYSKQDWNFCPQGHLQSRVGYRPDPVRPASRTDPIGFRLKCRIIPSSFLDSERGRSDISLSFSLEDGAPDTATPSPFYQPMLDQQTAEEACKQGFADMKPDLRPGVAQLLYAHIAYLARQRYRSPCLENRQSTSCIIMHTTPPMVEERELVQDLLGKWLICWTLDQHGSNAAGVTVRRGVKTRGEPIADVSPGREEPGAACTYVGRTCRVVSCRVILCTS